MDSISTPAFYDSLAKEMNAHPERFRVLGDADMVAAIVLRGAGPAGGDAAIRVAFEGLECAGADAIDLAEVGLADYFLDGPLDAWQAMFDDIRANGAATGRQTINSLALIGDSIRLRGEDPMGVDKFSRFNQTLQEYLDGAARVAETAGR